MPRCASVGARLARDEFQRCCGVTVGPPLCGYHGQSSVDRSLLQSNEGSAQLTAQVQLHQEPYFGAVQAGAEQGVELAERRFAGHAAAG